MPDNLDIFNESDDFQRGDDEDDEDDNLVPNGTDDDDSDDEFDQIVIYHMFINGS